MGERAASRCMVLLLRLRRSCPLLVSPLSRSMHVHATSLLPPLLPCHRRFFPLAVGFAIGVLKKGLSGGLLSGVLFQGPGFLILSILGWAASKVLNNPPAWLTGLVAGKCESASFLAAELNWGAAVPFSWDWEPEVGGSLPVPYRHQCLQPQLPRPLLRSPAAMPLFLLAGLAAAGIALVASAGVQLVHNICKGRLLQVLAAAAASVVHYCCCCCFIAAALLPSRVAHLPSHSCPALAGVAPTPAAAAPRWLAAGAVHRVGGHCLLLAKALDLPLPHPAGRPRHHGAPQERSHHSDRHQRGRGQVGQGGGGGGGGAADGGSQPCGRAPTQRSPPTPGPPPPPPPPALCRLGFNKVGGGILLAGWLILLVVILVLAGRISYSSNNELHWFAVFYRTGSIIFGGGQVRRRDRALSAARLPAQIVAVAACRGRACWLLAAHLSLVPRFGSPPSQWGPFTLPPPLLAASSPSSLPTCRSCCPCCTTNVWTTPVWTPPLAP